MHSLVRLYLIVSTILTGATALSFSAGLAAGPLLGPVSMREAIVWVKTSEPSSVSATYQSIEANSPVLRSQPAEVTKDTGLCAHIRLDGVEPGQTYIYQVEINGEAAGNAYQFRTPSFYHERTPPPDFTIAVAGSHYVIEEGFEPPYQVLGGGYEIIHSIEAAKPDFMLWVGNTSHLRISDTSSLSGIRKRFMHARTIPELTPLVATVPNYATWSQADYGHHFPGKAYTYRNHSEKAFREFWPQPTDSLHIGGLTTRFTFGDADFFVLDVNSHRNDTPNTQERIEILGTEQLEWLRQEIIRSKATFKVIVAGAPILNPADSRMNLGFAEREQTNLLQMLRDEDISGLFFISGGKPYGEMTKLVHANSYNLFDLTLGPLTAKPAEKTDELNFFRVPGTSSFERHFALIDFSGTEAERQLTVRIINRDGRELWTRSITAKQLQPEE